MNTGRSTIMTNRCECGNPVSCSSDNGFLPLYDYGCKGIGMGLWYRLNLKRAAKCKRLRKKRLKALLKTKEKLK